MSDQVHLEVVAVERLIVAVLASEPSVRMGLEGKIHRNAVQVHGVRRI